MNEQIEQWEYRTVWDNFQLSDTALNQLGAEGWELVSFNKASSQVWSSGWTFKRRIKPMTDEEKQQAEILRGSGLPTRL